MLIAGTIATAVKILEDGSLSILCQCRRWATILVKVDMRGGQRGGSGILTMQK